MAVELVPGVWWLKLRGVNAYLHTAGDAAVLVDTGFPWQADHLRTELAAAGVGVADLDRVLLTHADLDHAGGLSRLDLAVPVHVGAADAGVLRGDRSLPLGSWRGLLRRALTPFLDVPVRLIEDVTDEDTVRGLTAWHSPGHTAGHTVWVDDATGVAFLGDLARSTGDRLARVYGFLNADRDAVERTLRRFVVEGPSFETAAIGHGPPLRDGGAEALARLVA